jgi:hypothetical protein
VTFGSPAREKLILSNILSRSPLRALLRVRFYFYAVAGTEEIISGGLIVVFCNVSLGWELFQPGLTLAYSEV